MSTGNQQPPESDEEDKRFILRTSAQYERYKRKAAALVEEFYADEEDNNSYPTFMSLRELESRYHHFFIRKLVTVAMQRGDKEKERAAYLVSSHYGDLFSSKQVEKGFRQLVESIDFLLADIPDAIDTLAIFLTRALIDEILPASFLEKTKARVRESSKGLQVIEKAEKEYLTLPENTILGKWGGELEKPDNLKEKVKEFMEDYIETENKLQAYRDIDALETREFNQEILKYALLTAMERRETERCLYALLKKLSKQGHVDWSQGYKAFDRLVDLANEGKLDYIPKVRKLLKSLVVKAEIDRWIEGNRVKPLLPGPSTS